MEPFYLLSLFSQFKNHVTDLQLCAMTSCLQLSHLISGFWGWTGWLTQKLFSQLDELMEPNTKRPDRQEIARLKDTTIKCLTQHKICTGVGFFLRFFFVKGRQWSFDHLWPLHTSHCIQSAPSILDTQPDPSYPGLNIWRREIDWTVTDRSHFNEFVYYISTYVYSSVERALCWLVCNTVRVHLNET